MVLHVVGAFGVHSFLEWAVFDPCIFFSSVTKYGDPALHVICA